LAPLRVFALETHDLALTKLERNFERRSRDVEFLARTRRSTPKRYAIVTRRSCGHTFSRGIRGTTKTLEMWDRGIPANG